MTQLDIVLMMSTISTAGILNPCVLLSRKSDYGEGTLYWVLVSQKGQRKILAQESQMNVFNYK